MSVICGVLNSRLPEKQLPCLLQQFSYSILIYFVIYSVHLFIQGHQAASRQHIYMMGNFMWLWR